MAVMIPSFLTRHAAARVRRGWQAAACAAMWGGWALAQASAPVVQARTPAAAQQPAVSGDSWFFVDDDGMLHFASTQLDARYHRFSISPLTPGDGPLLVDIRDKAYGLAQASEHDRLATQRYFASSRGYRLHGRHLHAAAQRYGVDEQLLKAIATAESGFNASVVSPQGAVGLMQVIPDTAARFGVAADRHRTIAQKLQDPAINVPASARYVRHLQELFPGRLDLVLAAYNAGEGAVQRYGRQIPPYPETQRYVQTVMRLYASLLASAQAEQAAQMLSEASAHRP